jgi:hypothetical protein
LRAVCSAVIKKQFILNIRTYQQVNALSMKRDKTKSNTTGPPSESKAGHRINREDGKKMRHGRDTNATISISSNTKVSLLVRTW